MRTLSKETIGLIQILISATCFGVEPIIAKSFYLYDGDPLTYNTLRTIGMASVFLVILLMTGRHRSLPHKHLWKPVMIGIFLLPGFILIIAPFSMNPYRS